MAAGNWKEMYSAAQNGNLALVRYHIDSGSNPNYQHPEILATPLVAAITAGHTEIAIYLLNNGADPKLESHYDNLTPLQAATKYNNEKVLECLEKLGVKPSWWQKFFKK